MTVRRMIVIALLSLTAVVAVAQDRDVPAALRPYMTGEEFRAAGLHKLNPVELAQFQAWFVRTMRGREAQAAQAPQAPPQPQPAAPERASSPPAATATVEARGSGGEADAFGLERELSRAREIEAALVGRFDGWRAGTRFTLDNGQVWEAYDTSPYHVPRALDNPRVTIARGVASTYHLQVEGYNRSVRVRRIE